MIKELKEFKDKHLHKLNYNRNKLLIGFQENTNIKQNKMTKTI